MSVINLGNLTPEGEAYIDELRAKLAAAEKDAERYQYIRGDGFYVVPNGQYIPSIHGEALDVLIDAAIAKDKP